MKKRSLILKFMIGFVIIQMTSTAPSWAFRGYYTSWPQTPSDKTHAFSPSFVYSVRIESGEAMIYRKDESGDWKEVRRFKLVTEKVMNASISDDSVLVTMGDQNGWAAHYVVIYDSGGHLVASHDYQELVRPEEKSYVHVGGLNGHHCLNGQEGGAEFLTGSSRIKISNHFGADLYFDLKTGRQVFPE